MRIVAFVNGNSGPSYHRIIMPLMLMRDTDVYITNNLLEEHFEKGCDIFMYNRILPDHCLPMIATLKEKYGFRICVDIDDYWILDEYHILYQVYKEDDFAERQIAQLKAADIITCTHSRLAAEILPYNSTVHVLPNAIPKQGQFDIERTASPFTRLFWQGSDTHKEDINLLQRPIEIIAPLAAKVKMVMAGYAEDHDDWYKMVMDYTAKTKHQYKLIPFANVTEYYSAYAHADVCLIPLLNSPFNRHKSNLKVLEAANLSLPVICSDVHPYKDLPILYCNSAGDWVKHITALVKSKKRQKEAGQQLAEYCQEHFDFNKINKERKQILEYATAQY